MDILDHFWGPQTASSPKATIYLPLTPWTSQDPVLDPKLGQKVKNDQNLRFGFEEWPETGPWTQLLRQLLPGPPQNSKIYLKMGQRVKLGPSLRPSRVLWIRVPEGPSRQWPKGFGPRFSGAQMGSKIGHLAFSLTPDRQNDKIDFFNGKSGQMTKIWGPRAWVCGGSEIGPPNAKGSL